MTEQITKSQVGSRKLDIVDRISRRERTMRRPPRETQFTTAASLPSYEDVMLASDEIRDLVETQREFRIPDPEDVKTSLSKLDRAILLHSLSFTEMMEDLRRFVFPSMKSYIREIILPLLPATNRFPIYSVAVRVLWELEEYLFEGFDANVDIDDIATLTGEVAYAQALPCGEYMQQSSPRTGADTLTAVKYALKRGNSHEYPQSFPIGNPFSGIGSPLLFY